MYIIFKMTSLKEIECFETDIFGVIRLRVVSIITVYVKYPSIRNLASFLLKNYSDIVYRR